METVSRIIILLVSATLLNMCSDPGESYPEAVKIILDTDMGSDCDDAGALALLHRYADLGLAEIIGCIYSSGKIPYGAGITEAINIYYGRPDIPIGAYYGDEVGDTVDKMTAGKLVRDTVAFGNSIIYNTDAEEQTRLNRRLLNEQEDSSITYITIGHTKGLYELLVSEPDDISPLTGRELIKRKVSRWIALGALNANNEGNYFVRDWNFFFNETAPYTGYLVENFPVPVYYIDAGTDVMTGKSLKHTPPGNIVRTVYRDWLWEVQKYTLDDQRPSWDLAAVYFAVEGTGDFLENTGRGRLEFDVERGSRWHRDEYVGPEQYFIQQKEGTNDSFADYLNVMIAAEPVRSSD
ncbi:MAG: nucleoside hydrolase [Marinilabiliales bacterium]|nr:MAG: nucleoside hydrolase [Marinilabiliales bacterium]